MNIVDNERFIFLNGKQFPYHHRIYGGKDTVFIGDYPAYDFIAWLTQSDMQSEKDELAAIGLEIIMARMSSEEIFASTKDQREKQLIAIKNEQRISKLN